MRNCNLQTDLGATSFNKLLLNCVALQRRSEAADIKIIHLFRKLNVPNIK